MKRKAFTLVELLVVIAIIMILAALLFPVFSSAKRAAGRTVCISNMKQVSYGMTMYVSDHDGIYPGYAQYVNDPPGNTPIWTGMIQPYVKSKSIFTCPIAGRFAESYGDIWSTRGFPSIGINIHTAKWIDYGPTRLNESTVLNPAVNVLFGDSINGSIAQGYKGYIISNWDFDSRCGRPTTINAIGRSFSDRHFGTTNIGFIDGHVKNHNSRSLLPTASTATPDCRCVVDVNPAKLKWLIIGACATD